MENNTNNQKENINQKKLEKLKIETILDYRISPNGEEELFIKWKNISLKNATWELKKEILNYPYENLNDNNNPIFSNDDIDNFIENEMEVKNDMVCSRCYKVDNLIECNGFCLRSFHLKCLGFNKLPEKRWICSYCRDNQQICFQCKKIGTINKDIFKCDLKSCGKFYHSNCCKRNTISINNVIYSICPLHICNICNTYIFNDWAMICFQCPTSFHFKCMPKINIKILYYNLIICRNKHIDFKNQDYSNEMKHISDKKRTSKEREIVENIKEESINKYIKIEKNSNIIRNEIRKDSNSPFLKENIDQKNDYYDKREKSYEKNENKYYDHRRDRYEYRDRKHDKRENSYEKKEHHDDYKKEDFYNKRECNSRETSYDKKESFPNEKKFHSIKSGIFIFLLTLITVPLSSIPIPPLSMKL
jgi:hypothetical protein